MTNTRGHQATDIIAVYDPPDATYLRLARERIATGVSVKIDADGDFTILRPSGGVVHCGKSPSLARLTYLAAVRSL